MRYMRENKSSHIPAHHVFVDTETNIQRISGKNNIAAHSLRLWCAIGCEVQCGEVTRKWYESGSDCSSFWNTVYEFASNRYVLWIWAHNMSFDFTTLMGWEELDEGRMILEKVENAELAVKRKAKRPRVSKGFTILSSEVFLIKCFTKAGHRVNFISSTNFFKCKLEKLGELVGIRKCKPDFFNVTDEELASYCFNDVEILARAVIDYVEFIRRHDLGMFRATLGSQAMAAYRHRFMKSKILLHEIDAARKLEFDAHMGGECRAFFFGKVGGPWDTVQTHDEMLMEEWGNVIVSKVIELDVNSLYPSVMIDNLFPCRLIGMTDCCECNEWPENINPLQCIAAVKINSRDYCYPVRYDGRTTFARGKFWTTLAGPELQYAYEHMHIETYGLICIYQLDYLFKEFVDYFWRLRQAYKQNGNAIYSDICKKLLNSVYGKWSQRKSRWKDCDKPEQWQPWGTWIVADESERPARKYRAIAGKVQIEVLEKGPSGPFPAISAFVTSYGRMRMAELREIAGDNQVFYQGIDSLHVTPIARGRLYDNCLISPGELGKLRIEGIHDRAFYWGPMDYLLDDTIVRAGWKERGKADGMDSWKQTEFEGIDSILSSKPTGILFQWDRVLKHGRPFIHGTVGEDGWLVPTWLNREERT